MVKDMRASARVIPAQFKGIPVLGVVMPRPRLSTADVHLFLVEHGQSPQNTAVSFQVQLASSGQHCKIPSSKPTLSHPNAIRRADPIGLVLGILESTPSHGLHEVVQAIPLSFLVVLYEAPIQ